MSKKNPYLGDNVLDDIRRRKVDDPEFGARVDAKLEQLGVARQVKEFRQAQHLTQAQLAKRVGTTQSALARLESGSVEPSLGLLWKVAAATGHKARVIFEPMVTGRKQVRPRTAARRARGGVA
jgi:DNA-binding XRE family transcriptional regulator